MLSKDDLLQRLNYPAVWIERRLYVDEIFVAQLAEFEKDAGEHRISADDFIPPGGTEHFRWGAFCWWFARRPGREQLGDLFAAALEDPDSEMAAGGVQRILLQDACDADLAERIRGARDSFPYSRALIERALAAYEAKRRGSL